MSEEIGVRPWSWEWTRAESVRLQDGLLIADRGERYSPFDVDYRNLPSVFGKVTDERSACAFVRKYGLLGHHELMEESPTVWRAGEPLDWVLDHAKCVRFALTAINALSVKSESALAKALNEMNLDREAVKSELPGTISFGGGAVKPVVRELLGRSLNFGDGKVIRYTLAKRAEWGVVRPVSSVGNEWNVLRRDAQLLISILVNENTKGVRRTFGFDEGRLGFRRYYGFDALIEVIWYMIGDVFMASQKEQRQKEEGKGLIRLCECDGCSKPFIAHDKRQRFCPPEFGEKESLCAVRNRMRRRRKRPL
jgi:hypothetical protein